VAEVFAGFISGYVVALLTTPLLALSVLKLRAANALVAQLLPAGVSAVSLTVLLHGALFLFWTAFGMLLGLVLLAMGEGADIAGSRHGAFSLFVIALAAAFVAPVAIVSQRLRPFALAAAALVVVVFGWLMPYLTEWSKFDS